MKKSDREIMEVLEAFDATESAHSAALLAGVDPKTVRRYVAARDSGRPVTGPARRPRMLDGFMPKIEDWVEAGKGKVRADVYGGLKADDAKRLKELEKQNATLKRLLAEAELEKAALKELAEGNF